MSDQKTLPGSSEWDFSQESEDGISPCNSQDGRKIDQSGTVRPPASRFQAQENKKGKPTADTSGLRSSISSESASLQSFLENRLKQRLEPDGSTIYKMTWKQKVTPRGRSYYQLVASQHRISGQESGLSLNGWRSPMNSDGIGGVMEIRPGAAGRYKLRDEAALVGWPTPTAQDHNRGNGTIRPQDTGIPLPQRVAMAGWGTPAVSDDNNSRMSQEAMEKEWNRPGGSRSNLAKQAAINLTQNQPMRLKPSGEILTGSTAEMESGGQLSPVMSAYLMGYPIAWCEAAIAAIPTKTKVRRK